MTNKKTTITIIGGGNMGAAILSKIQKQYKVIVCEKDSARVKVLKSRYKAKVADLKEAITKSSIVILAVKPQDFDTILSEVSQFISKKHLVISIAAGITTLYIEKRLRQGIRVVRTMPNLPAQIGEAMTGICKGQHATKADLKTASIVFNHVGKTLIVDEPWIDAITAVSGSGPAYVFLFIECYMKAAMSLGFSLEQSKLLIFQTIWGSLELLEKLGEKPSDLRAKVTSKGGTTQAAMDVFTSDYRLEEIFQKALEAARDRAKELAK